MAGIAQPTLVATGGASDFYESAADAVAASVPNPERLTLSDQGHVPEPHVLAEVLTRFFSGEAQE